MNKDIMKELGFGETVEAVEAGLCPSCKKPVTEKESSNEIMIMEQKITHIGRFEPFLFDENMNVVRVDSGTVRRYPQKSVMVVHEGYTTRCGHIIPDEWQYLTVVEARARHKKSNYKDCAQPVVIDDKKKYTMYEWLDMYENRRR